MSGIPGGMSAVGNPVARNVIASALFAAVDDTTVMSTGLPYGGDGIIVGGLTEDVTIIRDTMVWPLGALRRWVQDNAHLVTNAQTLRRRAFGAWRFHGEDDGETDDLYLDIVEIFPREEIDAAVAAGVARNQISIWDAGRGEEIPTGGTGRPKL